MPDKHKSKKSKDKSKRLVIGGTTLGLIILIIWWAHSLYWPWPSRDEIDRRLDEVLEVCTYNEGSRACQNVKRKYNMTFRYCEKIDYSQSPDWGKIIQDAWDGKKPPVYPVAWEGTSLEPPKKYIHIGEGDPIPALPEYRNCRDQL